MSKFFPLFLAAILVSVVTLAQDVITTRTGTEIEAQVTEIGLDVVKYKKWDNPNGPVILISKSNVLLIRYQDGTKEIFDKDQTASAGKSSSGVPGLAGKEAYKQGATDAERYYRGYKGAAVGTLVVSILGGPIFGLIPAIACASSTPRPRNLDYPSTELFENRDYVQGYTKQARHIKSTKVWTNFGIGSAIAILVTLLANSGR